ncbi:MAG: Ig-like domain-containing protein [Bacteroidales bacterium]|jgi:hypothetical protein|nr:Ig-like domain-containing protein [Bacteroidales bacterium]
MRKILFLLAVVIVLATVNSCKKEVEKATINPDSITLHVGEVAKLNVKIEPAKAEIETTQWMSDNKEIVSVSAEGTIAALKRGTTTITVIVNNLKPATCTVTVNDNYLKIGNNEYPLTLGKMEHSFGTSKYYLKLITDSALETAYSSFNFISFPNFDGNYTYANIPSYGNIVNGEYYYHTGLYQEQHTFIAGTLNIKTINEGVYEIVFNQRCLNGTAVEGYFKDSIPIHEY